MCRGNVGMRVRLRMVVQRFQLLQPSIEMRAGSSHGCKPDFRGNLRSCSSLGTTVIGKYIENAFGRRRLFTIVNQLWGLIILDKGL